ncbi:MAG: S49 family peptidase [Gammaproteobacteria bacterium]|nr:S49 family peptidase [Gammaproteobacteria bacterium]
MSEYDLNQSNAEPRGTSASDPAWERKMITDLAFSALKEQRRTRRWGIFFKLAFLVYLFVIPLMFMQGSNFSPKVPLGKHTALVDIDGIIANDSEASADNIVTGLRDAFEDKDTVGVILRANSPGGSPVQAGYVYDEIVRLREKYPDIPMYAVITDSCASACYYIVSAADEIYANQASIVGSIGVLYNGFGYTGTMEKLGVERRLHTAGENKAILDPFSPEKEEDVAHLKPMLKEIHEQFIAAVKKGRGERLVLNQNIFSGLFWTGSKSVELGLVDGLASTGTVARDIIQQDEIVNFTPRKDFINRLTDKFGASLANAIFHEKSGGSPFR